jgi:hypothetical protein
MKKVLVVILTLVATPVWAKWSRVLETPNFTITIEATCEEGVVVCGEMNYIGVSKKSGNKIQLKGSDWHTLCGDRVTPCAHQGYIFKNGNVTYYVHDEGILEVVQNKDKVLVHEEGEWKD